MKQEQESISFINANNVDVEFPNTSRLLPKEADLTCDLSGIDGFRSAGNRWMPMDRERTQLIVDFSQNHGAPLLAE